MMLKCSSKDLELLQAEHNILKIVQQTNTAASHCIMFVDTAIHCIAVIRWYSG